MTPLYAWEVHLSNADEPQYAVADDLQQIYDMFGREYITKLIRYTMLEPVEYDV